MKFKERDENNYYKIVAETDREAELLTEIGKLRLIDVYAYGRDFDGVNIMFRKGRMKK